jgi:hypothetical protein
LVQVIVVLVPMRLTPGGSSRHTPILVAAVGATVVSRRFEMRSIYSARLSPPPPGLDEAAGPADPPRTRET